MVRVIMGLKGDGKTKTLIGLVTKAALEEEGDTVCIEKEEELTYDIPHNVRLIGLSQYKETGYAFLRGFICGLQAGNYDITHIFMDGLFKLSGNDSDHDAENFLAWCDAFGEREHIRFTITISSDADLATPGIQKYL